MLLETLAIVGLIIFIFVSCLFVLSVVIQRNDIADIAWGVGIMLVALTSYVLHTESNLVLNIMVVLIGLWGVRLFGRILLRNIKKSEDYRYKKWRDEWGAWFYLRSYFQVYLLQGFLMIVVGYSAVHASVYAMHTNLNLIMVLGILIWCIGYFFEVVADYQLDTFINTKPEKGSVLTTGLWKYSRHPNYFGEVTCWWGVWLLVATVPLGYFALISPVIITYLILKVSGIPMLEEKFAGNEQFEVYKKRTSIFFPLPPKQ